MILFIVVSGVIVLFSFLTVVSAATSDFQQQADKNKQEFEAKKLQSQQQFQENADKSRAEFENKKAQSEQNFQQKVDKNKREFEETKTKGIIIFVAISLLALISKVISKLFKLKSNSNRYENKESQKEAILAAGIAGEKETAFHLKFLPDSFTTYHNVFINVDEQSAENDHIIIGPPGVVLVETKNYSGTLYIRPQGWVREKFGKKEGCSSPVAQSERHRLVVNKWLEKNGMKNIPIHIVVAIADAKTIIEGEDPDCPVIKSESVAVWVTKLAKQVTKEQTEKIKKLLEQTTK